MSLLEEFKAFLTRGNVVDLAVAVVIGLAFTALVTAFVADVITPLIGIAGNIDFASASVTIRHSTILIGLFVDALISFLILAAVVFFALVKPVGMMEARRKAKAAAAPPTTRECPECLSQIPRKARRCSACTSQVTPID
jgi:large conductance mechanosensitive channel